MPQSLSTTEVANHLGITPRAVTKAIHAGRLPATRTGRRWTIDREDLALHQATRTEHI
ncbi:helix-turn-helix domain-containing protein [Microbacterium saperdae]